MQLCDRRPWAFCICPSSESLACEPQIKPEKPKQAMSIQSFLWEGCKNCWNALWMDSLSGLVLCLENLFHCRLPTFPNQRGQCQHCPQDAFLALNTRVDFGAMPPPRSRQSKEVWADSPDGKTEPARPANTSKEPARSTGTNPSSINSFWVWLVRDSSLWPWCPVLARVSATKKHGQKLSAEADSDEKPGRKGGQQKLE